MVTGENALRDQRRVRNILPGLQKVSQPNKNGRMVLVEEPKLPRKNYTEWITRLCDIAMEKSYPITFVSYRETLIASQAQRKEVP